MVEFRDWNKKNGRKVRKSFDTDPGVEQTGALYKKMNHLFPESDVKIFWVQLSPETTENNQQCHPANVTNKALINKPSDGEL